MMHLIFLIQLDLQLSSIWFKSWPQLFDLYFILWDWNVAFWARDWSGHFIKLSVSHRNCNLEVMQHWLTSHTCYNKGSSTSLVEHMMVQAFQDTCHRSCVSLWSPELSNCVALIYNCLECQHYYTYWLQHCILHTKLKWMVYWSLRTVFFSF